MSDAKLAVKAALVVLLAGGSGAVVAASADGTATATVVQPISVSETTSLTFGSLAIGTTAGTVVIDSAGVATPSAEVDLVTTGVTPSQATFTVTGETDAAITVTVDTNGNPALLDDGTAGGGGVPMLLDTFTNSGLPVALTGGSVTFNVGATLHVNASQAPGVYSTGTGDGNPYLVTVNYD